MSTLLDEKRKEAKLTLLECLAQHSSITEACAYAKVSRQTYYAWLDEDEHFRRHVAYAQEEAMSFLEGALYACAIKAHYDVRYQRSLITALTRRDRLRERQEDREERAKERAERAEQRRHEQEMADRQRPRATPEPARTSAPVRKAPSIPTRLRRTPSLLPGTATSPLPSGDGHTTISLPDFTLAPLLSGYPLGEGWPARAGVVGAP